MLSLIEEAVLLKISKAINNTIADISDYDSNLPHKLDKLNNKVIKVVINKLFLNLEYLMIFNNNNILINSDSDSNSNIDLTVELSIGSLVKAKLTSIQHAIREGDIKFDGDLSIAMELQSILNNTELNFKDILQENLSVLTSDGFACAILDGLEKVLERINLKNIEFKEQVVDYLLTEKKVLTSKYELEEFYNNVDKLRDDAARLDARVIRLQNYHD